jgi:hypothetical protein
VQDERRAEKEAWQRERQQLEQQLGQLVESVKLLSFDNDRLLKVRIGLLAVLYGADTYYLYITADASLGLYLVQ